jgi:aspartate/methionine/tyrosine aminotransferase
LVTHLWFNRSLSRGPYYVACPFFLTRLIIKSGLGSLLPATKRYAPGGARYLHYYSDRVLAAPHESLYRVGRFLASDEPDGIDLAQGAPRFDSAPSSSTRLPVDLRGWPAIGGRLDLRQAVVDYLAREHRLTVDPAEELLITPGAAGAWNIALDTFINPGDRVVVVDPGSPLYTFTLLRQRARIRRLTTWMENGRTRFRLDQLAQALRGARMMVLNSPANPTGGTLAAEDLEQIAWWASRRDVLLYSDDVFARYHYEGEAASLVHWPRARRITLCAGSLSQGHALASARVGWLAGCKQLIRPCLLTAVLQGALVPTLCQQLAVNALLRSAEPFACILTQFNSRRRYAFERLLAMGLQPAWPSGGYFLWVPVEPLGWTGTTFAAHLLKTRKVLVTPGEVFGPSGKGHIRISYAVEDGRLREGLSRLADLVRDQQRARAA